jgi:hypothetical protein
MASVPPFVSGVPTHALMHTTEAVGAPFLGLSNHDYGHFNNSKFSMVAPTVDATVPMAIFFPRVLAHAPVHPTETVSGSFGLSNNDYSYFNNKYSFSNNSKMAITVLTLDATIGTALSNPAPLMMTAAASPFVLGVPTSPPIDPMVALSR